MHFHYMNYMTTASHKKTLSRSHEIYNLIKPFLLGHYMFYYIFSFIDLCTFFRHNAFSLYDLYGHALAQELLLMLTKFGNKHICVKGNQVCSNGAAPSLFQTGDKSKNTLTTIKRFLRI